MGRSMSFLDTHILGEREPELVRAGDSIDGRQLREFSQDMHPVEVGMPVTHFLMFLGQPTGVRDFLTVRAQENFRNSFDDPEHQMPTFFIDIDLPAGLDRVRPLATRVGSIATQAESLLAERESSDEVMPLWLQGTGLVYGVTAEGDIDDPNRVRTIHLGVLGAKEGPEEGSAGSGIPRDLATRGLLDIIQQTPKM